MELDVNKLRKKVNRILNNQFNCLAEGNGRHNFS